MRQRILQLRKRIKEEKPLIHCITNPISIHDCANVVLAVGARPIMAEHPAEVTDITASAGALMLNLGNITDARIESMKRSMRTAMENKIPVLLDLVGVACSDLRLDLARELLRIGHPAVLKGNMSELLAVSGLPSHAIGIDAGVEDALTEENIDGVSEVLKAFSRNNQAIVLATGKQDFVTDGERVVLVQNGSAALSGITGTGCMVGALTAAFLPGCEDNIAKEMTDRIEAGVWSGVEMELNGRSGNYLAAAVLGTALMGIAGEEAEKISRGPGSFQVNLLDEIYGLSDRQLLDPEKYLYVCSGYPSCDSYIGAHKKSMRPMGTMADSNLRNKRIEAHRALDAIWKNGYMTKHSTYIWLQNRLNLREKDTHIGKFSYYLCEQTIRECTDYIKSREEKKKSPDKISVA